MNRRQFLGLAGLYQAADLQIYTGRGIGLIAPPVRFNCPPEATALTWRAGGPPNEPGELGTD